MCMHLKAVKFDQALSVPRRARSSKNNNDDQATVLVQIAFDQLHKLQPDHRLTDIGDPLELTRSHRSR